MRLRLLVSEAVRSLGANISTTVAATMTVLIGMFLLGLFVALGTWALSLERPREEASCSSRSTSARTLRCGQRGARTTQMNDARSPPVGRSRASRRSASSRRRTRSRSCARSNPEMTQRPPVEPAPGRVRGDPEARRGRRQIAALANSPPLAGVEKICPPPPGRILEHGDREQCKQIAHRVLSVAKSLIVFLVAVIVLLAASTLLIANTIRLSIFSRRREIEVMKLVGATNWFVRGPFMLEGLLCGLGGRARRGASCSCSARSSFCRDPRSTQRLGRARHRLRPERADRRSARASSSAPPAPGSRSAVSSRSDAPGRQSPASRRRRDPAPRQAGRRRAVLRAGYAARARPQGRSASAAPATSPSSRKAAAARGSSACSAAARDRGRARGAAGRGGRAARLRALRPAASRRSRAASTCASSSRSRSTRRRRRTSTTRSRSRRGRRAPRLGAHRRRLRTSSRRHAARPRRGGARRSPSTCPGWSRRCCRPSSRTTSAACARTPTGSASRSRCRSTTGSPAGEPRFYRSVIRSRARLTYGARRRSSRARAAPTPE